MEECITSDNTTGGSSTKYPRRIVEDSVSGDGQEGSITDDEGGEGEEDVDQDDGDEEFTPSNQRKSSRLQDKIRDEIPLEYRRSEMSVEEVALEMYEQKMRRLKRTDVTYETRSSAKGDTKIIWITTEKGSGRLAVLRDYCFAFNKGGNAGKTYWKCVVKGCPCCLTLLHDKFMAKSSEHTHPANLEDKMQKINARKQFLEGKKMKREMRLESLRQKEIKRRDNEVNGIIDEPIEITVKKKRAAAYQASKDKPKKRKIIIPGGEITEAIVDQMDVDDIDALPTNFQFDMDLFEIFGKQMDRLFNEISTYGLLQDQVKSNWDSLKQQIKYLAKGKVRIKDQRFAAMRIKVDKAMIDKEVAVESKRLMDDRLRGLNIAGAELLIKQLKEIMGKNEVYAIVNGEVVPAEVDEMKVKYQKAIKERDMYKLKIERLAAAASSSLALLHGDPDEEEEDSQPAPAATRTAAQSTATASSSATTSRNNQNRSATTIEVVHNHHHNAHQQHAAHQNPSYAQVLMAGPHEPEVLYQRPHGWHGM